jgi:hypothetical protein
MSETLWIIFASCAIGGVLSAMFGLIAREYPKARLIMGLLAPIAFSWGLIGVGHGGVVPVPSVLMLFHNANQLQWILGISSMLTTIAAFIFFSAPPKNQRPKNQRPIK